MKMDKKLSAKSPDPHQQLCPAGPQTSTIGSYSTFANCLIPLVAVRS